MKLGLYVEGQRLGVRTRDTRVDDARRVLVPIVRNTVPVFCEAGEDSDFACATDSFAAGGIDRYVDLLERVQQKIDPAVVSYAQRYHDASGAWVVIVDVGGTAIVTSDDERPTTGSSYLSRPEIAAALSGEITAGQHHSVILGIDLLYVAVPVPSGEKVIGVVRLTHLAHVVTDIVRTQNGTAGLDTHIRFDRSRVPE